METYKPTYEQLEKAVALFDHTIDSILEHAKYGSSLPSNATLMAQSHRLMVEDTEAAVCELRHILAPPIPTYEEVTVERYAIFGADGEEKWYGLSENAGTIEGEQVVKLTGTRRVPVKKPVKKNVSVGVRVQTDGCNASSVGNSPVWKDHPECHGKTGTLTFEWEE